MSENGTNICDQKLLIFGLKFSQHVTFATLSIFKKHGIKMTQIEWGTQNVNVSNFCSLSKKQHN